MWYTNTVFISMATSAICFVALMVAFLYVIGIRGKQESGSEKFYELNRKHYEMQKEYLEKIQVAAYSQASAQWTLVTVLEDILSTMKGGDTKKNGQEENE